MAGSYNHATTKDGKLRTRDIGIAIETPGDAFETIEEMFGMIWWLADGNTPKPLHLDAVELVEMARVNYRNGLAVSPGVQAWINE